MNISRKAILTLLPLIGIILALNSCTGTFVYNVNNREIKQVENNKIKNSILESGKLLGWYMVEKDKSTILGRIYIRNHIATVKIKYSNNSYSIQFYKANNLNYNKEKNTIHKRYNYWIHNLEDTINYKLIPLQMDNILSSELRKSNQDRKEYLLNNKNIENPSMIHNVINKNINTSHAKSDIVNTIVKSGNALGWVMSIQQNNSIIGKLYKRDYSATILFTVSNNSYSIKYITSDNLNYDSKTFSLHRNYNQWIKHLVSKIDTELTPLVMNKDLINHNKISINDKLNYKKTEDDPKIYDVIHKKIIQNYDLNMITNKIIDAGESYGWKMQKQNNRFILAKLNNRGYSATVRINYDRAKYSIIYVTSSNLNYEQYSIHKNYNSWIKNLEASIENRLMPLK